MLGTGLHAPIPTAYYWIFVPMVSLLTLLPVSVNGMGVREGGVVLFLAPLGVPQATALTLAFLWFLVYAAGGLKALTDLKAQGAGVARLIEQLK